MHARWNTQIITPLLEGCKASLKKSGVKEANIVTQTVPGSYELPFAVQKMYQASQRQQAGGMLTGAASAGDLLGGSTSDLKKLAGQAADEQDKEGAGGEKKAFDAVIAIGALIKGSTMHFEYISEAVSQALMRVQMEQGVPVVFGLLTLLTEEQGLERAGVDGKGHNHGEDWGFAAVELGCKGKGWEEGVFVA